MIKPLNGTKTHPLSEHAKSVLADCIESPVPTSLINAGVVNRLQRESGYICEVVYLPSPFKSHKGKNIPHLSIKKED